MRDAKLPTILMTVALAACASDVPTTPRLSEQAAHAIAPAFPEVIALPNGFSPFGMAFGRGNTFYVGSLGTGSIYRGDARTGTGAVLVSAQPGRLLAGMKYDRRTDRLYVAGGPTGQAYVFDATTGATLGVYQLADAANIQAHLTLVNDVVVLDDAAYFTDSFQNVVYRLPIGRNGELPAAV
jgi:outer membrane protein assembly factor BamB